MKIENSFLNKIHRSNKRFITIDGITCSGKTLFSELLKKELSKHYSEIVVISKDFFLISRHKRISLTKNIKNLEDINQNHLHYDQKKIKKLFNFLSGKTKEKNLTLRNLYNRKTGNNNYKRVFIKRNKKLFIYEGLYVNDDIKLLNLPVLKILITENVYNSLFRKIKRIRDKKISIQLLISEFIKIHLYSYKKYLKKNNFNYSLEFNDNGFYKISKGRNKQLKNIKNFFSKHSS